MAEVGSGKKGDEFHLEGFESDEMAEVVKCGEDLVSAYLGNGANTPHDYKVNVCQPGKYPMHDSYRNICKPVVDHFNRFVAELSQLLRARKLPPLPFTNFDSYQTTIIKFYRRLCEVEDIFAAYLEIQSSEEFQRIYARFYFHFFEYFLEFLNQIKYETEANKLLQERRKPPLPATQDFSCLGVKLFYTQKDFEEAIGQLKRGLLAKLWLRFGLYDDPNGDVPTELRGVLPERDLNMVIAHFNGQVLRALPQNLNLRSVFEVMRERRRINQLAWSASQDRVVVNPFSQALNVSRENTTALAEVNTVSELIRKKLERK